MYPVLTRALECGRALEGLPFPVPRKLRPFMGVPGSEVVQVDQAPTWATVTRDSYRDARVHLSDASLPPYAFLSILRIDVGCEDIAYHALCQAGAQHCTVSPVLMGFPHHLLVDPSGAGLGVRSKAALHLDYGKWDATVVPQVSLMLDRELIRLDALVALDITRGGPWVVVEFDGSPHYMREWDKVRDSRLIPPVLRFPNSCVLSPGFPEMFKDRLAQMLRGSRKLAG
jgi:hypothetical protein